MKSIRISLVILAATTGAANAVVTVSSDCNLGQPITFEYVGSISGCITAITKNTKLPFMLMDGDSQSFTTKSGCIYTFTSPESLIENVQDGDTLNCASVPGPMGVPICSCKMGA